VKIVISSGHGKYVRGASGYIDEVDEARKVVDEVTKILNGAGIGTTSFHDDVSRSQSENLGRIVDFHNSKVRDLDISVHFNAYETTSKPMGCEVLYVSQEGLAGDVVDSICDAVDFVNRGPKYRGDLAFLNNTEEPSILIETCFVDSKADVDLYHQGFDLICNAIAEAVSGEETERPPFERPDEEKVLFHAVGTCSHFGGPDDTGVSPSEGLAFIYDVDEAPHLFLPYQPPGTTGLARRLNPWVHYVACRWDYDVTSKTMLRDSGQMAWVRSIRTGIGLRAFPGDWGPHEEETGRAADLSPSLMQDLGITTDDEVEVIYPYKGEE
jgi:N-acetylmuramoyl-L-alanine amidase